MAIHLLLFNVVTANWRCSEITVLALIAVSSMWIGALDARPSLGLSLKVHAQGKPEASS